MNNCKLFKSVFIKKITIFRLIKTSSGLNLKTCVPLLSNFTKM